MPLEVKQYLSCNLVCMLGRPHGIFLALYGISTSTTYTKLTLTGAGSNSSSPSSSPSPSLRQKQILSTDWAHTSSFILALSLSSPDMSSSLCATEFHWPLSWLVPAWDDLSELSSITCFWVMCHWLTGRGCRSQSRLFTVWWGLGCRSSPLSQDVCPMLDLINIIIHDPCCLPLPVDNLAFLPGPLAVDFGLIFCNFKGFRFCSMYSKNDITRRRVDSPAVVAFRFNFSLGLLTHTVGIRSTMKPCCEKTYQHSSWPAICFSVHLTTY